MAGKSPPHFRTKNIPIKIDDEAGQVVDKHCSSEKDLSYSTMKEVENFIREKIQMHKKKQR